MNRWDLIVEQFAGVHMAQFEDGDYVRYEDVKKMEDALKEIVEFLSSFHYDCNDLWRVKKLAERGLS